jgi:predicted nuclease of restriction endonuclease-like (RecB) superfamily
MPTAFKTDNFILHAVNDRILLGGEKVVPLTEIYAKMESLPTVFYNEIRQIISQARNRVYRYAGSEMLYAYWDIGKRIVIEEQNGNARAEYGKGILKELSSRLTAEFGQGFDERTLRKIRQFYMFFPIRATVRPELNWSHYRLIITVESEKARLYYMNEAAEQCWSVRALERQIHTLTYERILSSKNKMEVKNTEDKSVKNTLSPQDIIKDPYILEFLNLPSNTDFYEKDLEKALIDKLQYFLLELGKGFSFVCRQKRFKADNEDYFVDLVFYNYLLKCFVLFDLKVGKLTYQDIGQMDYYVRYYEENMRTNTDNPTLGVILCTEKNNTIVKYSVLNDSQQLFASKYKLFLPSEEEFAREMEAERKLVESNRNNRQALLRL